MIRLVRAATVIVIAFTGTASAQVPPSNFYERELQDSSRSIERRQRETLQQQQQEFERNQRFGAPQTQRMPGEPRNGCPVGSAGC